MRGGLLRRRVGVGSARHAAGRAAPPRRARPRILAAEREPLRAQAETGHAVRHVLLQRVEEAHLVDCLYLSVSLSLSHAEIGPIAIVFAGASRRRRRDLFGSRVSVLEFARIDLEAMGRRERKNTSNFLRDSFYGRIDSPPIRGAPLPSSSSSSSVAALRTRANRDRLKSSPSPSSPRRHVSSPRFRPRFAASSGTQIRLLLFY